MTVNNTNLAMITLDCADPEPVSTFWSTLLGWDRTYLDENYAMLQGPAHALGFGRVTNYEAPSWPNDHGSKQFHFDLATEDIETTVEYCIALGAVVADEQPGQSWTVMLDPAGHPFCLTDAANW